MPPSQTTTKCKSPDYGMARAKGHNHQCRYSNERSHIYILLSSLNVVQISATVINTFTHITLVPLL
ncbi:MAG: hypothetical protein O4749_00320, partial [Trichodesmium sp. St5_bin2_1]|nr:hypothetical protein [Trichodesmium sp. St5_bin2_1]